MNLQPLTTQDIAPGTPLPWDVFDVDGHLLFGRGVILADSYPVDTLYRSLGETPSEKTRRMAKLSPHGQSGEAFTKQLFPPNEIKPQMWEIIQLRRLEHKGNAYYFSRMIGYIKDISILTTIPHTQRHLAPMAEREQIEVRMLTGRNIYVFQSEILKVCLMPSHYMHLSFPSKVQCQHLRKTPWAKTNLSVKIDCKAGQVEGVIVNLSSDGAQVDSPVSLGNEGLSMTLSFQVNLDGMKRDMTLAARIMHVRTIIKPTAEQSMLEHGVEFQNPDEQDMLWLRNLVYQRIAEGYLI